MGRGAREDDAVTEPGLYVYAVVAGWPAVPGSGIDEARLRLVGAAGGGPAAVVHVHDGGPYAGPDDDVRRWVVAHSDVVDRLWQDGVPVLPVSFNVIVAPGDDESAEDRLAGWLALHALDLEVRLAAVDGRAELRVELALDAELAAAGQPDLELLRAEIETRPPGVQRLMRRRLEERAREIARTVAADLRPGYRSRLAAVSEQLSENERPRRDDAAVPVLDAALLVPRDAVADVGRELAAIEDERPDVRIRYLGPWPPYSFADLPGVAEPASR
jgi:hypothetical protein